MAGRPECGATSADTEPGADPEYCRGGGGVRTNVHLHQLLLFFNKSFFHKKKYGKNICVSL